MNLRKQMHKDWNSIGHFNKKYHQDEPQNVKETKRKIDKHTFLLLRPKPDPEQVPNRINILLKHHREIIWNKYWGNFTGSSPPPRGNFLFRNILFSSPHREPRKIEGIGPSQHKKEKDQCIIRKIIKRQKAQDNELKNRLAKRDIFERAYWNWRTDKNKFKHKYKHFKQRLTDPQKRKIIEEQFSRIHKVKTHSCRPTPSQVDWVNRTSSWNGDKVGLATKFQGANTPPLT